MTSTPSAQDRKAALLAKLSNAQLLAEALRLEAKAPLPHEEAVVFAWVLGELFTRYDVTLDKARYATEAPLLGAVEAAVAQIPALN